MSPSADYPNHCSSLSSTQSGLSQSYYTFERTQRFHSLSSSAARSAAYYPSPPPPSFKSSDKRIKNLITTNLTPQQTSATKVDKYSVKQNRRRSRSIGNLVQQAAKRPPLPLQKSGRPRSPSLNDARAPLPSCERVMPCPIPVQVASYGVALIQCPVSPGMVPMQSPPFTPLQPSSFFSPRTRSASVDVAPSGSFTPSRSRSKPVFPSPAGVPSVIRCEKDLPSAPLRLKKISQTTAHDAKVTSTISPTLETDICKVAKIMSTERPSIHHSFKSYPSGRSKPLPQTPGQVDSSSRSFASRPKAGRSNTPPPLCLSPTGAVHADRGRSPISYDSPTETPTTFGKTSPSRRSPGSAKSKSRPTPLSQHQVHTWLNSQDQFEAPIDAVSSLDSATGKPAGSRKKTSSPCDMDALQALFGGNYRPSAAKGTSPSAAHVPSTARVPTAAPPPPSPAESFKGSAPTCNMDALEALFGGSYQGTGAMITRQRSGSSDSSGASSDLPTQYSVNSGPVSSTTSLGVIIPPILNKGPVGSDISHIPRPIIGTIDGKPVKHNYTAADVWAFPENPDFVLPPPPKLGMVGTIKQEFKWQFNRLDYKFIRMQSKMQDKIRERKLAKNPPPAPVFPKLPDVLAPRVMAHELKAMPHAIFNDKGRMTVGTLSNLLAYVSMDLDQRRYYGPDAPNDDEHLRRFAWQIIRHHVPPEEQFRIIRELYVDRLTLQNGQDHWSSDLVEDFAENWLAYWQPDTDEVLAEKVRTFIEEIRPFRSSDAGFVEDRFTRRRTEGGLITFGLDYLLKQQLAKHAALPTPKPTGFKVGRNMYFKGYLFDYMNEAGLEEFVRQLTLIFNKTYIGLPHPSLMVIDWYLGGESRKFRPLEQPLLDLYNNLFKWVIRSITEAASAEHCIEIASFWLQVCMMLYQRLNLSGAAAIFDALDCGVCRDKWLPLKEKLHRWRFNSRKMMLVKEDSGYHSFEEQSTIWKSHQVRSNAAEMTKTYYDLVNGSADEDFCEYRPFVPHLARWRSLATKHKGGGETVTGRTHNGDLLLRVDVFRELSQMTAPLEWGYRKYPYEECSEVQSWIQYKLDDLADWIAPSILDDPRKPKRKPAPLLPQGPTTIVELLKLGCPKA